MGVHDYTGFRGLMNYMMKTDYSTARGYYVY